MSISPLCDYSNLQTDCGRWDQRVQFKTERAPYVNSHHPPSFVLRRAAWSSALNIFWEACKRERSPIFVVL